MELQNNAPMSNHEHEILEKITSFIVSKISPEKVILFGSRARGEHRDDSDYDILILMKNLINNRDVANRLSKELFNTDLPQDIDIIIVDSERYEELKSVIGYIYIIVDREGLILYEK
jgi:predicted nucleotidyltransferase